MKTATTGKTIKSLKEDIGNDLAKRVVWFNDFEFADYHNINGVDLLCIVDADRTQDISDNKAQGVYEADFALFFPDGVLPGRPVVGGRVTFDGRSYFVVSLVSSDGILEMRIKANRS